MVCQRSGYNKVPRTQSEGSRTAKRAELSGLPHRGQGPTQSQGQGRDISAKS